MFEIEQLFQRETTYFEAFTNKKTTDFGYIFYNPDNRRSHDSNHAHILKIHDNPGKAVKEIKEFYLNTGLVPRVYQSFIESELEILKPVLESEGFRTEIFNSTFFLYPPDITPSLDSDTNIRRIKDISEEIIDLIHSENDGDWTINVLKYHVHSENFHLLGLYRNNKCIAMASVNIMAGYSRVDDVLTHRKYRGYHSGTKLIKYLVNYHREMSDNYLYLWAVNPIAVRMYRNIGFEELRVEKPFWAAYIQDDTSV